MRWISGFRSSTKPRPAQGLASDRRDRHHAKRWLGGFAALDMGVLDEGRDLADAGVGQKGHGGSLG